MNVLKTLWEQLVGVWSRSSNSGKLALIGLTVLSLVSITGVGLWSARPQYVTLSDNLAPSTAAQVISALESEGIPFKMNVVGSAVLVPQAHLSAARLATSKIAGVSLDPSVADAGSSLMVLTDPEDRHERSLRLKEAQLKADIQRHKSIARADVRIARPKWSPFPTQREPAKASVVVEIAPASYFSKQQAAGIALQVSSAVEGLAANDVTVVGTDGIVYWSGEAGLAGADFQNRLEYRHRLEADLAAAAESMLAALLGPGKARVVVRADVDFTATETTEKTYSPTGPKSYEVIDSSNTKGGTPTTAGAAGTASTIANAPGSIGATATSTSTEKITTEWFRDEKNQKTVMVPGAIRRLTVSATVDLSSPAAGAAAATNQGGQPANSNRNPYTVATIESLIKNAVGFDDTRSDQITVLDAPLADPGIVPEEKMEQIESIALMTELARNSSLGIGAVAALIIAMWVLKKMKPITLSPQQSFTGQASQRSKVLTELQQQIAQNPETVSKILAAWLNEPGPGGEDEDQVPAARAA